ncbi:15434_t:CDS:2 [Funneliformis mosseae]|uniref:15434_t:CDS:1 n=1 Tax=Funneliformis mosseae TaxID=27381 RepID=A0A9N8VYR3_FUNMO|nr:15434_t:CDS:2 [Funneliformis mosseae]
MKYCTYCKEYKNSYADCSWFIRFLNGFDKNPSKCAICKNETLIPSTNVIKDEYPSFSNFCSYCGKDSLIESSVIAVGNKLGLAKYHPILLELQSKINEWKINSLTQEEYDLHTDDYANCIKKAYNKNITQKYIKEYLVKQATEYKEYDYYHLSI